MCTGRWEWISEMSLLCSLWRCHEGQKHYFLKCITVAHEDKRDPKNFSHSLWGSFIHFLVLSVMSHLLDTQFSFSTFGSTLMDTGATISRCMYSLVVSSVSNRSKRILVPRNQLLNPHISLKRDFLIQ